MGVLLLSLPSRVSSSISTKSQRLRQQQAPQSGTLTAFLSATTAWIWNNLWSPSTEWQSRNESHFHRSGTKFFFLLTHSFLLHIYAVIDETIQVESTLFWCLREFFLASLLFSSGLVKQIMECTLSYTKKILLVVLWDVALMLLCWHNWGSKKDPDMKYILMLLAQERLWCDI